MIMRIYLLGFSELLTIMVSYYILDHRSYLKQPKGRYKARIAIEHRDCITHSRLEHDQVGLNWFYSHWLNSNFQCVINNMILISAA